MADAQEHGAGERRGRRARSSSGRLCEGRPTDHYAPLSALLRGVSYTGERKINGWKELRLKGILPVPRTGRDGTQPHMGRHL